MAQKALVESFRQPEHSFVTKAVAQAAPDGFAPRHGVVVRPREVEPQALGKTVFETELVNEFIRNRGVCECAAAILALEEKIVSFAAVAELSAKIENIGACPNTIFQRPLSKTAVAAEDKLTRIGQAAGARCGEARPDHHAVVLRVG